MIKRAFAPPRFAALALAPLLLSACATKGDIRDLQDALTASMEQQQTQIAALQRQTRISQDSLVRGTVGELGDIRGTLLQQIGQILDELEQIRALSGENRNTIRQLRQDVEDLRRLTLARGVPADTTAVGDEGPLGQPRSGTADEMYEAAVRQWSRGSLRAAQIGFEQFLIAYPNDELAPWAQYYLADILVQQDQLAEAILQFERVQELYPDAPKVADALYRIGILYIDMGDEDDARRYLERVINSYPESASAELAQDRLRELGGQ